MAVELTPSQAAARIGATTRSVQRWIAAGRLPARRVGGRWRVASDALDAFAALGDGARVPGVRAPGGRGAGGADAGLEIHSLFVANRSEIARRIARTARTLGIAATVPETAGPSALDLLDARSIVSAALAAGADAVHPGYGFLAESPDLAAAAIRAGLIWVGPPPGAIRALGDKAEARGIARSVGVPVATGEEPSDQSDASLGAAADRIGYPVIAKPAAGGGGKGIRVVEAPGALAEALASARREAARAFGDDRVLLERYLPRARHVEVQVLADRHGNVVHLGDRDCSLQRRHQKLLEEAPAPGLDPVLRSALRDAAIRLTRAVRYENAGTCEFLVAEDGSFVFLEMNARLQVEHPVTELVVGRDLVADQLRIASGATLAAIGLEQVAIEATLASGGHAIEVRLNAEDPIAGFLPTAGRIVGVAWPAGAATFGPAGAPGVRVDAGIEAGDVLGGRFDPLLAKVIAHGSTRAEALDRLTGALDATEVLGVVTNLRFLRRLVRQPVVREASLRVDTLDGDPSASPVAAALEPLAIPGEAWDAAAASLAAAGDPVPWAGGWRLNLPARIRLVADGDLGGEVRTVEPRPGPGPSDAGCLEGDTVHLSVDGRSVAFRPAPPPDLEVAAARGGHTGAGAPDTMVSPMPGLVLGVHAAEGERVEAAARIATLEAMKMEHVIRAPRAGRIEAVLVRPGDQVERGRVMARLGPEP